MLYVGHKTCEDVVVGFLVLNSPHRLILDELDWMKMICCCRDLQ
jgi:hypothetical protein